MEQLYFQWANMYISIYMYSIIWNKKADLNRIITRELFCLKLQIWFVIAVSYISVIDFCKSDDS